MFIWTAKLHRGRLLAGAVALVVLCGAAALVGGALSARGVDAVSTTPASPKGIKTNEDRVAYLQSLGWEVEAEPVETLQFLLPESLGEPHLTYNQLQLEQGFDLSACCGKQVSRFTYNVTNYPDHPTGVQLNLYVCENQPVAGDICSPGAGGFQAGLRFPDADT